MKREEATWERPAVLSVIDAEGWGMPRNFFNVVMVRSIEETVEIVIEAKSADDAHDAALQHLKSRGDEYAWSTPRKDLTVWHKQEIDPPAIVDVAVQEDSIAEPDAERPKRNNRKSFGVDL
jgi:hypothetical protein